mmetsp:Transcript_15931/g.32020  ORF Transcript_15931/g.32020 Transcript_15931/m.32020 type:complete len:192 (-) Transcript_15931:2206-2781(-)
MIGSTEMGFLVVPTFHHARATQLPSSRRRVRPRAVVQCNWVSNRAHVEVEAEHGWLYDVFADLEMMPTWSPWLESVEVDRADDKLSTWRLAARGINVSWRSRITRQERGSSIAWESISGLANRGEVSFRPSSRGTTVTMEVAFLAPDWLDGVLGNQSVSSFVSRTMEDDLKRFRSKVLIRRRRERINKEVL